MKDNSDQPAAMYALFYELQKKTTSAYIQSNNTQGAVVGVAKVTQCLNSKFITKIYSEAT